MGGGLEEEGVECLLVSPEVGAHFLWSCEGHHGVVDWWELDLHFMSPLEGIELAALWASSMIAAVVAEEDFVAVVTLIERSSVVTCSTGEDSSCCLFVRLRHSATVGTMVSSKVPCKNSFEVFSHNLAEGEW